MFYADELKEIQRRLIEKMGLDIELSWWENQLNLNQVFYLETGDYTAIVQIPIQNFNLRHLNDMYDMVVNYIIDSMLEWENYDAADSELG